MRITIQMVQKATVKNDPWALGNQLLYDLCHRHPRHRTDQEIVAKVWLIGRAYAASIERGRGQAASSQLSGDRFHTEAVTKALKKSRLDQTLKALARSKVGDAASLTSSLEAHAYLIGIFHALTKKKKRSLASKYLHFHLPDYFYIYDQRAERTIRALNVPARSIEVPDGADPLYSRYVSEALGVYDHVLTRFGKKLTPRQIDRLMLAAFEKRTG